MNDVHNLKTIAEIVPNEIRYVTKKKKKTITTINFFQQLLLLLLLLLFEPIVGQKDFSVTFYVVEISRFDTITNPAAPSIKLILIHKSILVYMYLHNMYIVCTYTCQQQLLFLHNIIKMSIACIRSNIDNRVESN